MAGPFINKKYALLEEGKAPMGKHQGKYLRDLPATTLLYYADQFEQMDDTVYGQYISKCIDVALELGYIKERDDAREADYLEALKSDFIGEIGERIEFDAVVSGVYLSKTQDYYITIMKCGKNIVKYFGNNICQTGETVKIKATIKRHDVLKQIKSTTIGRPKRI